MFESNEEELDRCCDSEHPEEVGNVVAVVVVLVLAGSCVALHRTTFKGRREGRKGRRKKVWIVQKEEYVLSAVDAICCFRGMNE